MQEQTKQNKVAVESWIKRQHEIRQQHELQCVLKQATDVRVMHADRGGRAAKMLRDVLVAKVLLCQRAHAWMLQCVKQSLHLLHHAVNVTRCGWQKFLELLGGDFLGANGVRDHLNLPVITLRLPNDVHKAGANSFAQVGFVKNPNAQRRFTRCVANERLEIRLARARGANLRIHKAINTADVRIRAEIFNRNVLLVGHHASVTMKKLWTRQSLDDRRKNHSSRTLF